MISGQAPRLSDLGFTLDDLEGLRSVILGFLDKGGLSLGNYYDNVSGGFFHVLSDDTPTGVNEPGDFSKTSTATVLLFLFATGRWSSPREGEFVWHERTQNLCNAILDASWDSAGLGANNAFTSSFLIEALAGLRTHGATIPSAQTEFVRDRLTDLRDGLLAGDGVAIAPHPPHSYLTHLSYRALRAWSDSGGENFVTPEVDNATSRWAMGALTRELAINAAVPERADIYQIAYASLLLSSLSARTNPTDQELVHFGFQQFFNAQFDDGGWPLGRALFHYPKYGNAYCHEYEFLVQFLSVRELRKGAVPYLDNFARTVGRIARTASSLPNRGHGWSSGHHQQLRFPESWSTASVLHFCFLVDRLLGTAASLGANEYLGITTPPSPEAFSMDTLLDSEFPYEGNRLSLRETLRTFLVEQVRLDDSRLMAGQPMEKDTPVAAILFGPPGTSKTTYARAIADSLGWQLLSIDPSHLLRRGLDGVLPELNELFRILNQVERAVVFFDEIDELVRERFTEAGDPTQRFLTTAMLPKIASLRDRRRTVLLVATNHLEVFDTAIRRPGRFDMIVPVLPPTVREKLAKWDTLRDALARTGLLNDPDALDALEDLTFSECAALVKRLTNVADRTSVMNALLYAADRASYREVVEYQRGQTMQWKEVMTQQFDRTRLPPPNPT